MAYDLAECCLSPNLPHSAKIDLHEDCAVQLNRNWSGRLDLNQRPPAPKDWFHEESTL